MVLITYATFSLPLWTATLTAECAKVSHTHLCSFHLRGRISSGLFTRFAMKQDQKDKLSKAQLAYIATDERWQEHRRKLAQAQESKRITLTEEELRIAATLRGKGRTFSFIQEEIGVCHDVIRRELQANGISTERIKRRRATRGKGYWRSFDVGVI